MGFSVCMLRRFIGSQGIRLPTVSAALSYSHRSERKRRGEDMKQGVEERRWGRKERTVERRGEERMT